MPKLPLVLVINDVRSAHNIGSIWRTADAVGLERLIITGISPYPPISSDTRLPHVAVKAGQAIAKTALGAESTIPFEYCPDILVALANLRGQNYNLCALEQTSNSTSLFNLQPNFPLALIVGHETTGISQTILDLVDTTIEIPQFGHKESLNVSVATGIALYFLLQKFTLNP